MCEREERERREEREGRERREERERRKMRVTPHTLRDRHRLRVEEDVVFDEVFLFAHFREKHHVVKQKHIHAGFPMGREEKG